MSDRPTRPAAEVFPLMSEADLPSLTEDVRSNGLHEAISLDAEGRVPAISRHDLPTKFKPQEARKRDAQADAVIDYVKRVRD